MKGEVYVKKIYRTFFIRNLSSFMLPVLIPLVMLGGLSIGIIQRYVGIEAQSANRNVLNRMQADVELLFEELDTLHMHAVSSALEFDRLRKMLNEPLPEAEDYRKLASFKNFIDSPAIARPYIESIYVYVENGRGRFISSTTGGMMAFEDTYDAGWYESYAAHRGGTGEKQWTESRSFDKYGLPSFRTDIISLYQMLDIEGENDSVIVLNVRLDYLKEKLALLPTSTDQHLLIAGLDGRIIAQEEGLANSGAGRAAFDPKRPELLYGESVLGYDVSELRSADYGLRFVSVTPNKALYELPIRLALYMVLASVLSILAAVSVSLHFARRNVRSIRHIVDMLHDAEQGTEPAARAGKDDVNGYIVQQILANFLEKKYLKTQLDRRQALNELMELSALQSQLNPHFLLNTLESIKWKAAALAGGMDNDLTEMIEQLGSILRGALDLEEKYITVEEEIRYTESYIAIQRMRIGEAFDVRWDCRAQGKEIRILKLLLQPLIENSLVHGLHGRRDGLIKIKIYEREGRLCLSVSDNGKGMSLQRLEELRGNLNGPFGQSAHIGVFNTHKRLLLAYGPGSGLRVYSKPGVGTLVKVEIPAAGRVEEGRTGNKKDQGEKAV
ncbi:sensor histidine kinase YesM [Saccharibacillus kuerlensis]|uniref:Sensor histidine kinase YesM n=1 Tax=Saccharibacillus kuerlensis TaxID=459527 RepID=A0ABQ2L7M2_9BACL|nr:sensor histidine kinase YesM [Saccharibacillus kuerlensis]